MGSAPGWPGDGGGDLWWSEGEDGRDDLLSVLVFGGGLSRGEVGGDWSSMIDPPVKEKMEIREYILSLIL